MAYWPPKTNWVTTDGIGYDDLNFIGEQSESVAAAIRRVHGFGFGVDNSQGGYDGLVTVTPGGCFSENGAPIRMAANHTKSLAAWAAGSGAAYGGMASAVTVAAHTWYYMFIVMNPADGSTEIIFDDNIAGTNVAADVGAYSQDGDRVFYNPTRLELGGYWIFTRTVGGGVVYNQYGAVTLTSATYGLALPAKIVRADLLCATDDAYLGFRSKIGPGGVPAFTGGAGSNLFTPDTPPGTPPNAEHYFSPGNPQVNKEHTDRFDIMADASSQIDIAIRGTGGTGGEMKLAVLGYYDDRFV